MFLKSISAGLRMLSHWQIWAAVVLYSVFNLGFSLLTTPLIKGDTDDVKPKGRRGLLLHMLAAPLFHGVLMSVLIYFLLPTLMGGAGFAPILELTLPLRHVFTAGLKAVAIIVVLGLIPFLGDFIVDSLGMRAFLTGVLIFRFLTAPALQPPPVGAEAGTGIYPGLWVSLGLVITAAVLEKAALLISALILIPFEGGKFGRMLPIVMAPFLVFLAGFIPFLMYTSYVRLLLESLLM